MLCVSRSARGPGRSGKTTHLFLQLALERRKQLVLLLVVAIQRQALAPPVPEGRLGIKRSMHQVMWGRGGGGESSGLRSQHASPAALPTPPFPRPTAAGCRNRDGGHAVGVKAYRLAMRLYCCLKYRVQNAFSSMEWGTCAR
jgi:hypothetical protein